jgi:hypothetical protein
MNEAVFVHGSLDVRVAPINLREGGPDETRSRRSHGPGRNCQSPRMRRRGLSELRSSLSSSLIAQTGDSRGTKRSRRCWLSRSQRPTYYRKVAYGLSAVKLANSSGTPQLHPILTIRNPSTSLTTLWPFQRSVSWRTMRRARSPPSSSFILSIVLSCSHTLPTALLSGT